MIIATDHDEFVSITPRYLLTKGVSILIDGKNCLDKEKFIKAGIYYKGIGR
jgi:UDP-N-acetyl-D-mannosaminuronate dehydrogenase